MIPLSDDNRVDRAPVASRTILLVFFSIFLWQTFSDWGPMAPFALGFRPVTFFAGGSGNPMYDWVPYSVTLLSYAFLHSGWLHFLSNALFLWIFGDDVEDVLGHVGFIVFYLMAAVVAALAQAWPDPESPLTVIGASGAVSGVLGAFLVFFPRTHVKVLVPIFIVVDIVRLPAAVVLVFWFAVQLAYEFAGPEIGGNVAFRAHIGGFVFGMLAAPVFARVTGMSAARMASPSGGLLR